MSQSLELNIWLGVAGTALCLAYLLLWRTRHSLTKPQQDLGIPDGSLAPQQRAAPVVSVAEMATSVSAA